MTRWRPWLAWLKQADLRLVVQLLAIGVLVMIFIKVGHEVSELSTDWFDHGILLALRDAPNDPIGPPAFEAAVMHLSGLGSGTVTGLVVLIAATFLALAGRWRMALMVIACAVGTLIIMELLKGLYDRPRPTIVTAIDPPGGLSFPSGHSMISAALYMTLGVLVAGTQKRRRLRTFAVATGALLAFLIGASRLYLGVHYPTDVIAGWTVGCAWALVCGLVARGLGDRLSANPSSDADSS